MGGGAGGVELILAMVARVSSELRRRGRSLTCLSATLVARSSELLQGHAVGVRRLLTEAVRRKGIRVLLSHEAVETSTDNGEKILKCRHEGRTVSIPFDECAWCTQAAAPEFLSRSGLDMTTEAF